MRGYLAFTCSYRKAQCSYIAPVVIVVLDVAHGTAVFYRRSSVATFLQISTTLVAIATQRLANDKVHVLYRTTGLDLTQGLRRQNHALECYIVDEW